jgi:hypothetical protein
VAQCVLKTPAGETPINIPPPGNFDAFYLFAMHKSGSTLLNRMMNFALIRSKVPQIAIPEVAFAAGLPENDILNPEEFIFERGYCYRGFRVFPGYLRGFDLSEKKKVLLVRDPRDMVVSYYFSMAKSHVIPQGAIRDQMLALRRTAENLDIDEFCLNHAQFFRREFLSYQHLFRSDIRIYRYEDIIFAKEEWLREMLDYFGVSIESDHVARIAAENDVRPQEERPHEHIRQVTPGNFRKHLSKTSIERLKVEFEEILNQFEYED